MNFRSRNSFIRTALRAGRSGFALAVTGASFSVTQVDAAEAPVARLDAPATTSLGKVSFPNSGKPEAQDHFLRGLAALHSFWYEEAVEQFQAATTLDPEFALGYWGEALSYNQSLWAGQDREAARRALGHIKADAKITPREKAYIDAAWVLYGEGEKGVRAQAYAKALEKVHAAYPDDLEAAAFYALSLLSAARNGDNNVQTRTKAAAIALEVYAKNPEHPGAAHYVIHAFDDPDHAILALPAARRYASIAPEAFHALHMPSHIFTQLGLWPEAASSNESSWAASVAWVQTKNLEISMRDYHSYQWLVYVYTQQGRYREAGELVANLGKTIRQYGPESVHNYESSAASYIVNSRSWDLADGLYETAGAKTGKGAELCGTAASPAPARDASAPGKALPRDLGNDPTLPFFIRAFAAASRGADNAGPLFNELRDAHQKLRSKKSVRDDAGYASPRTAEIRELEIAALISVSTKAFDQAIDNLRKATKLEEESSREAAGPPRLVKPSHELLGEVLLKAGKPAEAVKAFEFALSRQSNRAPSVIGLARAQAQSGEHEAALASYAKFLENWQQADTDLPELREARDYLKNAEAPKVTLN